LVDSAVVEVTSTEIHAQFWPSRWAFGWFADCSLPGVCWLQLSAAGDRSYPYDRPIVIRGDTPRPAVTVTPAVPWSDGQLVTVTVHNLEPRRFGVVALCLDPRRMVEVREVGSGDGLSTTCTPLATLSPTAVGV
jgi:hypothetical protein